MNSQLVFVLKEACVNRTRESARELQKWRDYVPAENSKQKVSRKKQEVVLSRPGKVMQILHNVSLEMPPRFF